jgi:hypothetical protein
VIALASLFSPPGPPILGGETSLILFKWLISFGLHFRARILVANCKIVVSIRESSSNTLQYLKAITPVASPPRIPFENLRYGGLGPQHSFFPVHFWMPLFSSLHLTALTSPPFVGEAFSQSGGMPKAGGSICWNYQ